MQAKEFDNFRKKFVFKNVNITRKVASTDQEAADKSPDTIKKIIKEKEAFSGSLCWNFTL